MQWCVYSVPFISYECLTLFIIYTSNFKEPIFLSLLPVKRPEILNVTWFRRRSYKNMSFWSVASFLYILVNSFEYKNSTLWLVGKWTNLSKLTTNHVAKFLSLCRSKIRIVKNRLYESTMRFSRWIYYFTKPFSAVTNVSVVVAKLTINNF